MLQEEIEEQEQKLKHQKRGGKSSSSSTSSTLASASAINHSETLNSVIGEELQAKIDENATLHARLSDVDRRYEDLVSSLRGRIAELESEARDRAQQERAEDTKHKDVLLGLRSDKEELERRIKTLEGELVDQQDRITVLTVQLESAAPSANNNSPTSSSNNFPLTASDARVQSVELLSQFGDKVTGLVAAFSDFHTYWEHRLKDLSADGGALWDSAASLSRLLLQNVSHLKPVEEAYQKVLSEVLSNNNGSLPSILALFRDFSRSFKSYVSFALEAETLTVSCLQYESQRYSCPPSQQAFNTQLGSSLHAFNRVLTRAADYLQTAVDLSSDEKASMETLDSLSVCLSQLATQAGELHRTYANKASDEAALPTVTEQLKNTNQCIVAALASIEQGVGETSRLMATNLHRIELLIKSVGVDDNATMSDNQRSVFSTQHRYIMQTSPYSTLISDLEAR